MTLNAQPHHLFTSKKSTATATAPSGPLSQKTEKVAKSTSKSKSKAESKSDVKLAAKVKKTATSSTASKAKTKVSAPDVEREALEAY